jgi:hypothetical protein
MEHAVKIFTLLKFTPRVIYIGLKFEWNSPLSIYRVYRWADNTNVFHLNLGTVVDFQDEENPCNDILSLNRAILI